MILFILSSIMLHASASPGGDLGPGDRAPEFSLPYATRDSIGSSPLSLSQATDSAIVVLAFYPADWSSGCTKEVCSFRDAFFGLDDRKVLVLGISGDYVYSHHEWARHHNLPFHLLSDHSHEVAVKYNSYNEANGYNRRTVYVIDRSGIIRYVDLQFKAGNEESLDRLRRAIESLQ
jgi:peroxiredoxin